MRLTLVRAIYQQKNSAPISRMRTMIEGGMKPEVRMKMMWSDGMTMMNLSHTCCITMASILDLLGGGSKGNVNEMRSPKSNVQAKTNAKNDEICHASSIRGVNEANLSENEA